MQKPSKHMVSLSFHYWDIALCKWTIKVLYAHCFWMRSSYTYGFTFRKVSMKELSSGGSRRAVRVWTCIHSNVSRSLSILKWEYLAWMTDWSNHLDGLVVKASTSTVGGPGFVPWSIHTRDLKKKKTLYRRSCQVSDVMGLVQGLVGLVSVDYVRYKVCFTSSHIRTQDTFCLKLGR